jgi:alpha-D-ribose 1-methylphosphonate 5-triphosphate diphosphatase
MTETILANARLVLPTEVIHGSLLIEDGVIRAIDPGPSRHSAAIDFDGDFLIPGVVDVHTDNLERQVQPRLNARWPSRSAMVAHDAQCAAAGVTTVLDAVWASSASTKAA